MKQQEITLPAGQDVLMLECGAVREGGACEGMVRLVPALDRRFLLGNCQRCRTPHIEPAGKFKK